MNDFEKLIGKLKENYDQALAEIEHLKERLAMRGHAIDGGVPVELVGYVVVDAMGQRVSKTKFYVDETQVNKAMAGLERTSGCAGFRPVPVYRSLSAAPTQVAPVTVPVAPVPVAPVPVAPVTVPTIDAQQ